MSGQIIIACGSFKWELTKVLDELSFEGRVVYIPAILHLRPNFLRDEFERVLEEEYHGDNDIFVVYGKCFIGIQELCEKKGAKLVQGEHCFQMFLGEEYCRIINEEPGTYFFTHHLAENFKELCIEGLKFDRYPKLKKLMFGHYKKALFIDTRGEGLTRDAKNAASCLGLPLGYSHTGIKNLREALIRAGDVGDNKVSHFRLTRTI